MSAGYCLSEVVAAVRCHMGEAAVTICIPVHGEFVVAAKMYRHGFIKWCTCTRLSVMRMTVNSVCCVDVHADGRVSCAI